MQPVAYIRGGHWAKAPPFCQQHDEKLCQLVKKIPKYPGFSFESGSNPERKLFLRGGWWVKRPKKFRACGAIFIYWLVLASKNFMAPSVEKSIYATDYMAWRRGLSPSPQPACLYYSRVRHVPYTTLLSFDFHSLSKTHPPNDLRVGQWRKLILQI